jgi:hypothetical protein
VTGRLGEELSVTDVQLPPQLTVWGDFASPWSALLSMRVDAMRAGGLVEVDWRAVRLPWPMEDDEVGPQFAAAFEEVVQHASPGELVALRLPRRPCDSTAAALRYAALDPWERLTARGKLFEAVWDSDLDISSPVVLDMLVPAPPSDQLPAAEATVAAWQAEWQELGGDIVPLARGADGRVLRGRDCVAALDVLR